MKGVKGERMARGVHCPPPQPTRVWEHRKIRKLSERGLGQSPGRNQVSVHFELERSHVVTKISIFDISVIHKKLKIVLI